jgi:hypothetical protein
LLLATPALLLGLMELLPAPKLPELLFALLGLLALLLATLVLPLLVLPLPLGLLVGRRWSESACLRLAGWPWQRRALVLIGRSRPPTGRSPCGTCNELLTPSACCRSTP